MKHKFLSFLFIGTLALSCMALTPKSYAKDDMDAVSQDSKMIDKEKGDVKEKQRKRTSKMAKELGLTEEQQAEADRIRKEDAEEIKELMRQMREIHKKIDEKRKANMEKFENILTPEQKEKFEAIKKKQKENAEKHFKKRKNMNQDGEPMKMRSKEDKMKDDSFKSDRENDNNKHFEKKKKDKKRKKTEDVD